MSEELERKEIEELFTLNEELRQITKRIIDTDTISKSSKDLFCHLMAAKTFKSHEAVLLLCRNGYGEDALILARSLFDLLVTLLYILKDPTDNRINRYLDFDFVATVRLFKQNRLKGKLLDELLNRFTTIGARDDHMEKILAHSKSLVKKYNYGLTWSDKNIYQMAEEVGRVEAYQTIYKMQCDFAHSNARGLNEYITRQNETEIEIIACPSIRLLKLVLVHAFDMISNSLFQLDKHLIFGVETDLKLIDDKYRISISKIGPDSILG